MDILQKIVASKKLELIRKKELRSVKEFEAAITTDKKIRSFSGAIKKSSSGIIAEFKRRSPSKKAINLTASPLEVAEAYEANGAAAMSVLTNEEFFQGSIDDIISIRPLVNLPILRKEFIIDEYQILEAKSIGANAILLIAEILDKNSCEKLASFAHSLGLEVLLEMHTEEHLNKINEFIDVIGINNRDLKAFKTDPRHSVNIFSKLPREMTKISESGLHNVEDVIMLKETGYHGFLIGEYFMRQDSPGKALHSFIQKVING